MVRTIQFAFPAMLPLPRLGMKPNWRNMSKIMYAIWLFSITPFNPAQRQTTTPRTRRGKHSAISRIPLAVSLSLIHISYTAWSPLGPRIALAVSEDIFHWRRLGLATFASADGIEFGNVDDKDASLFPAVIPDPSEQPELALLHRPLFPGTRPEELSLIHI